MTATPRNLAFTLIIVGIGPLVGCGTGSEPTAVPTLVALTIQASDTCTVGTGGLPLSNYTVVMRDERSGSDWLFLENRDVGPRDQSLMLRLTASAGMMTGKISGPAIIATDGGRMTVLPNGDVVMTAPRRGRTERGTADLRRRSQTAAVTWTASPATTGCVSCCPEHHEALVSAMLI
jgi:hypothetical protein